MLKEQIEPQNIAILEMDELYIYVQKKLKKHEYGKSCSETRQGYCISHWWHNG